MDLDEIDDLADLALIGLIGHVAYEEYKHKKCKWSVRGQWVRELNLNRTVEGFYARNFHKMQTNDPQQFLKKTRMKPQTFELRRVLIEPSLEKSSWREPIYPSCRLFLVLLYLSQVVPKQVLAWIFRMGYSTVQYCIYETCDVIWNILMPHYLQSLSDVNWKQNAVDFKKMWNLPNCVSAIDGKHINMRCPPRAGSEYYNYKGQHSILLLAACDADYIFVAVDVGDYGSQSDGGIFAESSFGKKLLAGDLNLPPASLLPNSNIEFSYHLVGDAAFPLKTYLMRPYPGRLLNEEKYNFNKRLSRARRLLRMHLVFW